MRKGTGREGKEGREIRKRGEGDRKKGEGREEGNREAGRAKREHGDAGQGRLGRRRIGEEEGLDPSKAGGERGGIGGE